MSENNIKDFSRIGISIPPVAVQDERIANTTETHTVLNDFKIGIYNTGTLRKYSPGVKVFRTVESNSTTSIYEEFKLSIDDKGFYAESKASLPLFGQVSFYGPGKKVYDIQNVQFFNNFLSENRGSSNFKGSWPDHTFIRASFTSGYGNTNTLHGFTNKTGVLSPITTQDLSSIFTGRKSLIPSKDFIIWNKNYIPGETGTTSLSNFYLSYPNTISTWNYNAYNIPLKITTFTDDIVRQDLEGILLISTGIGAEERICYISPHKATTGLFNTVIYNKKNILNTNPVQYTKIPSGILLKAIVVGSEYFSGDLFPSGVRPMTSGDMSYRHVYSYSGFMSNVDGFYPKNWNRLHTLNPYNSFLRQTTPIKDTAFYQMYSGLYNSSRKFNTGVWNGIIPSGSTFKIELLGCEIDTEKEVGTNNFLYPVYSGYGKLDRLDTEIYDALSSFNTANYKFNNTNIKVTENNSLYSVGRGRGVTKDAAHDESLKHLRYIIYAKFSNMIKNNIPNILFKNRKLKKLLKFLSTRDKYIGV